MPPKQAIATFALLAACASAAAQQTNRFNSRSNQPTALSR